MMQYLLSGIESHPDKGFGVTADAYYKNAQHLEENPIEDYDFIQQAEMPQNFLYRHAIELYLKSLIVIFHKRLEINYGTVPFDSDEPEIFIDGKWKKLYTCHFIDKLYEYWLNQLLLPNIDKLKELAPMGEWKEYEEITKSFDSICEYDRDSSYFRYPITKNASFDNKKYSIKKLTATEIESLFTNTEEKPDSATKRKLISLFVDKDDNVVDAYGKKDNILSEVRDALKKVATYFYSIHIMTRVTICNGN